MDLLKNTNIIEYIITPFVIVGAFPLVTEINKSSKPFFSENYIKWIVLWGMFYSKTHNLLYSTIISLFIMSMFPRIFFGEKTYFKED